MSTLAFHPVQSRWGSWLEAAFYYALNLPETCRIVESIDDDDGVIVKKAKESLQSAGLINESLTAISRLYGHLKRFWKKSEYSSYTVEETIENIGKIDFLTDPREIKEYIDTRF